MNYNVISYLKSYKNSTISLSNLENLFSGDTPYDRFAADIKEIIYTGILEEINPKHNNGKSIPLAYKFKINRYNLRSKLVEEIKRMRLQIEKEIDLEGYLNLDEDTWQRDLPYIKKVNEYIARQRIPEKFATPQERSFDITGDEKWIDEKGGRKLLERLKIWDKLKIESAGEPLMLAVNPHMFSKKEHIHLIVENKATFYALIDNLRDTACTSLIFGSGWKIVSNIYMLDEQMGHIGNHKLYYFGDLDREGISIWSSLNERVQSNPAVEFYRELLKKPCSMGKENQVENKKALEKFLKFFTDEEGEYIKTLLGSGEYYPQEGLNKDELKDVWRNASWTRI